MTPERRKYAEQIGPGMEVVVDKIRKLLAHAAGTTNEEEKASFEAKAQAMLLQYNLDAALIEQAQGRVDGRREEAKLDGGFYLYQRELYKAVAALNFCSYFTEDYAAVRTKTIKRTNRRGRWDHRTGTVVKKVRIYAKGDSVIKKRHRIIGRQVNTAGTKAMASYLEDTIERLIRERLTIITNGETRVDFTQLYSNWGISFREGMVDNIIEKIEARRKLQAKAEDAKRRAADKMKMNGSSTATSLTVADFAKSEEAANYDFVYGEGAWAEELAREARAAARWKTELARRAQLAKDNPEAAKREEKERREAYRGMRYDREYSRNKDYSAFHAGHRAAEGVSLDPQTGHRSSTAGLLR